MSTVEDQAAALRAKHGKRWKIWYVPLALGGYTWCARIHGDDLRNVVHADTAGHLDEHIRLREEDLAADARLSDPPPLSRLHHLSAIQGRANRARAPFTWRRNVARQSPEGTADQPTAPRWSARPSGG